MPFRYSPTRLTVPLDHPGRSVGHIILHVPEMDAPLRIPIAVFNGRQGPTVLLTGGVHGDEFDGPIVLSHFVHEIDPDQVQGRLIIIPVLNLTASQAGRRASPLDNADLNRTFPGNSIGTASQVLAHFVATELVPMSDVVIDSHTGGTFDNWVPLVMMHHVADREQYKRTLGLVRSMQPPIGIVLNETEKAGMFDTYVEQQGKIFVCAEWGGGTLTNETLRVARACLRNALGYLGILPNTPETPDWPAFPNPTLMQAPDAGWAVTAKRDGIYEPVAALGQTVEEGELLGRLHVIDDLSTKPFPIRAPLSGTLFFRPALNRVEAGRRLAMICRPLQPNDWEV